MDIGFRSLVCAAALCTLAACAGKIDIGSKEAIPGAGLYRSRLAEVEGGPAYQLELMSNGRFTLKTFAYGCQVGEETGLWSSGQESLQLDIHASRGRDGCAGGWIVAPRREQFICPLRQVSGISFQMLHNEIGLGAQWTEWKRQKLPSVASGVAEPAPGSTALKDAVITGSDLKF
ncbi:MAG TPA: hypothetical protein VK465_06885 [Fibrobacteria bacterium]|nr:hypothetical protein [Fibrobacteria bacterium]